MTTGSAGTGATRLGRGPLFRAAAVAAALCIPAAAIGASKEGGDKTSQDDPETIEVVGEADDAPADLTAFRTSIRAEDFDRRIASVAELLAETVGLHVRSFGGLSSFATVSIRGSTSEQVNVYVDGVPLNAALGGAVNLTDLSLESIASIDVYRGFSPSWLPGGAIGGAVDIRTRRPAPGDRTVTGSLSYGSYDTANATARASFAGARADGLMAFSGRGTEGDFTFFDNNGTPLNGDDDGYETRENNRSWSAEVLGAGRVDLKSGGRARFDGLFTRRRQGVPGIDAFQSSTARSEMTRALTTVGLERRDLMAGRLRLDLDVHYGWTAQEFEDDAGDTTGGVSTDARDILQTAGPGVLLRCKVDAEGALRQELTSRWSARWERADRRDRLSDVEDRGTATRWTYDITLEDALHMPGGAGGHVVLTPSLRFTSLTSDVETPAGVTPPPRETGSASDVSPKLGAAWLVNERFTVRGNVGRFYRAPTLAELFGDAAAIKGNAELQPEEGANADVGVTWEAPPRGALDRLHVETVLFASDADNLIQLTQTSQSQVIAQNTGDARIRGAEFSLGLGLLGWLRGSVNYTFQDAEDRSDTFRRGDDLPGRPRHVVSARASATRAWGRPYYEFDYVGPNYSDAASAALAGSGIPRDLIRIPGRYIHGAGYTQSAGRLEYTIEVTNIFDVKTVDIVRYPLPGRLVEASVRVALP